VFNPIIILTSPISDIDGNAISMRYLKIFPQILLVNN
jgi:hypothetical protein